MRVLVIGGAGYIGSHTVRALLRHGHIVTTYDNLSTGHRAAVAGPLFLGDIRDASLVERTLREQHVDLVMHFAATSLVGESVSDPAKYYDNNITGTIRLLDAMRGCGVGRIVFSSTAATYGVPAFVPITESHPQRPINPYGFTKLAIEQALADYTAAYGMGAISLRYFNAAGAAADASIGEDHRPETHLIPLVLQTALGRRPHVQVFGTDYATPDGTCIRDYVHVDDLAEAHIRAMQYIELGTAQAFNLGIGHGYSVRELIDVARRITGRPIAAIDAPRRAGDPPSLVAAAHRIRRVLDWRPHFESLEAIIESAWRWHRAHPDGFGA
jgi:UDP-glucose-4-epimerase GalE